ncbi:MAG: hypothetical protein H6812_01050 [Phycisphaeraceae bacterium]|nr:hypothetical protein [Phycisphaerales bacterium]MCB9841821.1 hypothetical protein [Phycisphaeraceae bacterium]
MPISRTSTLRPSIALLLIAAAVAMPASEAAAQNALRVNNGSALDANLRVGSGGRNIRPRSFSDELNFRNAIVTGNVAGGMGFRGDVGYTAPLDFRGDTGSGDQFGYRADAFYSGLATRNIRGIDALRTQLQFTTFGQTSGVAGPLIINRPDTGVGASGFNTAGAQPLSLNIDQFDNGSMRSISAMRVQTALGPELLARLINDQGDKRVVTGSEIEGIRLRPDTTEAMPEPPPTRIDRANPNAEPVGSNLSPHAVMLESLRRETDRAGARLRGVPGDTDQPEELRPPTPEGTSTVPDLLNPPAPPPTIEEMLEMMRGELGDSVMPDEAPETESDSNPLPSPLDAARNQLLSARQQQLRELESALFKIGEELDPQPFVNKGEVGGDRYLSNMMRGQELLEEGHWFDAEERFTMALASRPGDSMAAAGRIHAQIGAGMFRSAAINIRNLYRAYPELIPVRFESNLLPSGDRLELLKRQLAERSRLDTAFAVDASIVMAYLGHQIADYTLRDAGFARINEINQSIGAESDPLILLLERVWTR